MHRFHGTGEGAAGNTPLDDDELEGLIPPHIATRSELNDWEANNITQAFAWASTRSRDILAANVLRTLHTKMFGETWSWAGTFRKADKNISPYHWTEVPRLINDLLAGTKLRHAHSEKAAEDLDELAARFHHELVRIHPWPNGNGRHARLATDLLLSRWGRPQFSWGSVRHGTDATAARTEYLEALRNADAGKYDELIRFVRS